MEYSELVDAIKQNDRSKADKLLRRLMPRLLAFLRIHLNANQQDAEDCAQQALLTSLEAIRDEKIRNKDRLFSFLLTCCKNNYLNMMNRRNVHIHGDISHNNNSKPRQLSSLMNKERRTLLEHCLEQLSRGYKTFIDYWFKYPDSDARAAASHFNISVNNAWTRKHRVINKLNDCYKKKSEY
ncbi:MAG TPA: sigma-70 family RNA polymerase sigma factor [Balneolaceae bacterium]|nr:sigma-70 family RNA polymerase sigma factor [Balneolaceae bacterium]